LHARQTIVDRAAKLETRPGPGKIWNRPVCAGRRQIRRPLRIGRQAGREYRNQRCRSERFRPHGSTCQLHSLNLPVGLFSHGQHRASIVARADEGGLIIDA
jgi:hypothetical protein